MSDAGLDLSGCDREPIHVPGAIQPHGMLLVIDAGSGKVIHAAGDVAGRLGKADWLGADYRTLLGTDLPAPQRDGVKTRLRRVSPPATAEIFDASLHGLAGRIVVELEPTASASSGTELLLSLEAAAESFERAGDLPQLCAAAAIEFRRLTGYDRVMVYRFLEDDTGIVLGEDRAPDQHSFLNHRFPASDIPKQARALYVRNLVRVIPDIAYVPAPIEPPWADQVPFDMSDCELRSVSPIHLQYLHNMGVAASASVSIVIDGHLWGLIACHNATPKTIDSERRIASRVLASGLSRQIKARDETDTYRERVRLRTFEDGVVDLLLREGSLDSAITNHLDELRRMLDGDGVAVLRRTELVRNGRTPSETEIRKLAAWASKRSRNAVYTSHTFGSIFQMPPADQALAGGVLAITLSGTEPWVVVWFRAEEVEIVEWAGNPHKDVSVGSDGNLSPRSSFASWTETVRGRARPWTLPETESARRLREAVLTVWQTRQIVELNRQLLATIEQKDGLLKQNEYLLGEINHRVQNSLQLVSSFLQLQARESGDAALKASYEEARRRIAAVSLVHRRLYSSGQNETIDAARYVDELLDDLVASIGPDWERHLVRDLQPIVIPNDRAVGLGLVLTELIINANKYAYGGSPGPLRVTLTEEQTSFRLVVADQGGGRQTGRTGFGTRMMDALVERLGGRLDYADQRPGTRATLVAPIATP